MSSSIPTEHDVELRAQRRQVVLRHVRARRASSLARKSAVARTAVLLRSTSYHEAR
ncbi:hypothetical protein [Actinopolymorpha pittospori]|uniref:Uncharacterized protein n=1 Tax=Actinopolymorpha pittospori TaxID=648752 RepID=A0A927N1W5_9ACTN|nr:hypothetical protein [Actinopolymorpha pittospori]MBE1611121.1 hypothetical protein [Actinopolymorpha pittospori]